MAKSHATGSHHQRFLIQWVGREARVTCFQVMLLLVWGPLSEDSAEQEHEWRKAREAHGQRRGKKTPTKTLQSPQRNLRQCEPLEDQRIVF